MDGHADAGNPGPHDDHINRFFNRAVGVHRFGSPRSIYIAVSSIRF
jgi:hypothetical protein